MMLVLIVLAVILALVAIDVHAQSVARDPWSLLTYVWVGVWAAAGGLVHFAQKVKRGDARWLNFGELVGEIVTSAFIGIVTGLLCEAGNLPKPLTWGLVGLSGHMGGRGIFWLEGLIQKFVEKKVGVSVPPSDDVQKSA